MTNEELARAIQGGDKDKLLELWGPCGGLPMIGRIGGLWR